MEIRKRTVSFTSPVSIVDNEISNDISPDWNYERAELSIVGILSGNEITQIILHNKNSSEKFKEAVKNHLDMLPKPLFAFNRNMERGNFIGFLGKEYSFEEIKPFRGPGTKEQFFGLMCEKGLVDPKAEHFQDPLKGDSAQCIPKWNSGRMEDREEVIKHNVCCLTKEAHIHMNREKLL